VTLFTLPISTFGGTELEHELRRENPEE